MHLFRVILVVIAIILVGGAINIALTFISWAIGPIPVIIGALFIIGLIVWNILKVPI